jgi:homoserine dehydrogenase
MRRIPILQIGVGGVGRALIEQVLWFNERRSREFGFRFAYIGLADRSSAIVDDERIPPTVLLEALSAKRGGGSLIDIPAGGPLVDWQNLLTPSPCIVVDVTAQDGAETQLAAAVGDGHRVVLANKKPLCASLDLFHALTSAGQTRYEATVGAGLPIVSTLRSLIDTGDQIQRIEGCFSGTLGFLTTELQNGRLFSSAVAEARVNGWTEPDPRDDLSGADVARKALILARTSGFGGEFDRISVEALYPKTMADLSINEFMAGLTSLDEPMRGRFDEAAATNQTWRYMAQVATDTLHVGLVQVDMRSAAGQLQGPDNLVVFQTRRYHERALRVSGPGAGVDITAAGVLSDLIAFGREWH